MIELKNEKGRGIVALPVKNCARCESDHLGGDSLLFEKLDHFSKVGDFTMVFWAMCSVAEQPIMLGVVPPGLPSDPINPDELPIERLDS